MNSIQSTPIVSLDSSFLESPIPSERQESIVAHFWRSRNKFPKQHFQPYFQYYTEQCRVVYQSHGNGLPIRTHQHIVEIATCVQDGSSRSEVNEFVQKCQWISDTTSQEAINASIDLTVRLLFMLDVGDFANAYSGRKKLLWVQGSMHDFVRETFSEAISLEHDGLRLDGAFNVCKMIRIAGFGVELTCNLYDHLRLRDVDKTVIIFHHASFLTVHRQTSIFPPGLVDETLATLALLFPQGDKEVQRWYNKQDDPEELDKNILSCGMVGRQIGSYRYWHDRLVMLKTEFDRTQPSTISQWWNDRRDGRQWYPLWVALSLTVLFGLVQSIEGALQVYKAYHP
ncbi:hypothetical protein BDW59DRAFT_179017 [Aspergillus cavernicola]|uniref:Uncharacterized protein n=1 Tax=Aspergillus cavernicola TaxID=176166 RepID=A0ABR4IIY4_9EURO